MAECTFIEGFDDDAIDGYFPFSPGASTAWHQETGPDNRGKCIEWNAAGSSHDMWLATGDPDEFAFGFRLYLPAETTVQYTQFLDFGSNGAGSQAIRINANNGTTFQIGSQSYTGASGDTTFTVPTGAWTYLEFHVDRTSGAAMRLRVYVDGTLEATWTGSQSSQSDLQDIRITMANTFSAWKLDDMYVWSGAVEAEFPYGDVRVDRLLPVGDGAVDDWTASYTNLDDANPSTSTGTTEAPTTSGDQLTLEMDTQSTPGEHIIAVAYQTYSKGSGRFKPLYRSAGGTTAAASERIPVPADWGMRKVVVNTNPVTATGWTQSDVANGEFGLELE